MLFMVIWSLVSAVFLGLGVGCFFAKRQMGFWANAKAPEVTDIRRYNRSVGIIWILFSVLLFVLGLFSRGGQNSPGAIVTILGTMLLCIVMMIAYSVVLDKYRRKNDE
ncbi:hypothetical protein [Qiania dongpingensis]|uniref:DUF3784 domain-containing protein n=1 Tax=Qiania dongpingensis TaxID=2763669 RepID=A0A7G9G4C0_9FIRM|nr:hypothetical protein [Qiania dongpingensis]QNM05652.1 hypothetical protein H9Q78_00295 [Qiania dongpingensis]